MPTRATQPHTPARLLRLWALYARMDLLWITRDVKMFLTFAASDTVLNVGSLLGMLLLAERFAGVGVWSKVQVLFLLSYSAVCGGLIEVFFGFNVAFISRRIGRGQLDHVLVQPQPIWMALLTEGFCPFSGAIVMAPGLLLMAWTLPRLMVRGSWIVTHYSNHEPRATSHAALWFIALLVNIAASTIVALSFQFLWGSIPFLAPRAAEEINSSTSRLLRQLRPYPLDGLAPALTGGLLAVLPVGFLGWLPCRALLGMDDRPLSLWITPIAAVGFGLIAASVFQMGLIHYGRTGSQRYLPHGHRS